MDAHLTEREIPASLETMPLALKNLDISLGLAVIPVHLFTATSGKGVAFHMLHARCGSRIQMPWSVPSTESCRAKRR
jgi:hypothetical protein